MFNRFRPQPDPAIQTQIDAVIEQMSIYGPDSPEYPIMMEHLERLEKLKAEKQPSPISRDTMLIVGAQVLLGIAMLTYEKTGVITSKVSAMVVKPMK